MADYPPARGAKATRSARATYLLLWGGVPSMGSVGGWSWQGGCCPGQRGGQHVWPRSGVGRTNGSGRLWVMGQWASTSQLGRHSMGWPGSGVRHSSPRVPDKRGGASQGAQPSRLRSPKRAKAPRSEGAYHPPTKGAKTTRSVGATYLLLWWGAQHGVGWGVGVGGVVWAKRQWPAPRW